MCHFQQKSKCHLRRQASQISPSVFLFRETMGAGRRGGWEVMGKIDPSFFHAGIFLQQWEAGWEKKGRGGRMRRHNFLRPMRLEKRNPLLRLLYHPNGVPFIDPDPHTESTEHCWSESPSSSLPQGLTHFWNIIFNYFAWNCISVSRWVSPASILFPVFAFAFCAHQCLSVSWLVRSLSFSSIFFFIESLNSFFLKWE